MPSQTAVDTIAKRDLDSAYRPNRHLVWLSILHDAWHQDPLKIQPPVLRMGESQWADWSTWTATAPASRWDNLALIKVAPISTQLETTSGSGVWDTVPDALRFDITDGGGTSINVGTLPVPRAAGWPMISSILRIENGGASYDVIPQWDTILQPDFKAEDKDHNKWRDRGLFLIRSPLTPFGRLVIAAKMPAVTAAGTVPIGTGVGNRISRYEDGDDNAFIIISVLSDRVLRLTADTWRTAMEPGSDLSVTADATASVHDITIRIWFANEDRSVPDGITLRRASFTIAMRGKTSERSMADDRSAVTRLKRRDLTR
jgi:hypothetical protein